jgi:NAD(P)-dependent dehydrogenase (short-subunit alcohol dehydrogenase family)
MQTIREGKSTYLVLGASGATGLAVAETLSARESNLLLAARDPAKLEAATGHLDAERAVVDVCDPRQIEQAFCTAQEAFGAIFGVVNCAGSLLLKPAHLTSDEQWSQTIDVNLRGAFNCVRAAGKHMRGTGGSVVLFSSAAANLGLANHEAIAAAKAGVEGLVRSAAATYGPKGLRFNAVAPGLVRSRMTERLCRNANVAASSAAMHAVGRIGEPQDVASMVAWLLDPANHWVTGQIFRVDGGLASVRTMAG